MRPPWVPAFGAAMWALALMVAAYPGPLPPAHEASTTAPATTALDLWREMDADVLADVALGEDPDAPVAVAWTVLNRARTSGLALELVVQKPWAYGTRRGDRFMPSWRRVPGRRWARSEAEWERVRDLMLRVLRGDIPDPTGGATHFHREGSWTPTWAPEPKEWSRHGSHWFYGV